MTRARVTWCTALLIIWGELLPQSAAAQTLGTFRWQLQPYCNVLSVTVTQNGASYTLDGYDDQCGAATRAPLVGLATPNPDGTIGLGFHIVTSPAGAPVAVSAAITLATVSGAWRDSGGHSGTFAYNASTGGSPRPAASAVFPGGISSGGAPVTNVGPPVAATDAATKGYVDAADAVLAAQVPPVSQFTFQGDGGFVARGAEGVGAIPATGPGVRIMWYPAKGAIRAGHTNSQGADDAAVGRYSTAFGYQPIASGDASFSAGTNAVASGFGAAAIGASTIASGFASIALGQAALATGASSFAIGADARANGLQSTAIGSSTTAAGLRSTAIGAGAIANADNSTALGNYAGTAVGATGSFVYGDASDVSGVNLVSSIPNQFMVRAAGGTVFYSNAGRTTGVALFAGAGAWTNLSDAARKQSFTDLDGETVLGKLRAMPIREWSYIAQGDGIRHVGPTAQDFRSAFGLGEDPLGISTIDADGISLRAIQALEARTQALHHENARLMQRLEALETALAVRPR
ncbi:MAG: hypothetical protein IT181_20170 [Acidobacteria bacterium]|nr:hypothetical protein [Acidobacteriota bacterium]